MKKAIIHMFIAINCITALTNISSIDCIRTDPQWPSTTLATLSRREKIAQLLIPFIKAHGNHYEENNIDELITSYGIGGVIFLGHSTPLQQRERTELYQKIAKVPLLIMLDSEWGLHMRLDHDPSQVVQYPKNMALGAIKNRSLIYQLGYEIGQQCRTLGVAVNLAPVADVNNNPQNPVIHLRSFGDNVETVTECTLLYARGVQDAGIIACVKHFPGHGDTAIDSHVSLPTINHPLDRLQNTELIPFKKLIDAGIAAVMTGHLYVPAYESTTDTPATFSPAITHDLLQKTLGFNGLVITDGLNMKALSDPSLKPGDLELKAFLAGHDILLCSVDIPDAITTIEQAIIHGTIDEAELDRRVLKILRYKQAVITPPAHTEELSFLTRPEAYALQQQLYEATMTSIAQSEVAPWSRELLATSYIVQSGTLPDEYLAQELSKHGYVVHTIAEMVNMIGQHNDCRPVLLIIGNHQGLTKEQYGIPETITEPLKHLQASHTPFYVITFNSPYGLAKLKAAQATLVAYESCVPAQKAVIKVLNGDLYPTGTSPVHVN